MSAPTELYCLACRKRQPVSGCQKQEIKFVSKKTQKNMSRTAWVGKCEGKRSNGSDCGKSVRCFVASKSSAPIAPQTEDN